ncbi:MAG TPA: cytochrome c oxidase subunit 4 [Dermatophilaceae bacterium]|nr:cytochrome c oxidase subunit 4 [Dermatophilaceae bacterium]
MKVEFRLFVVIGVFFTVVGLIYGTATHWTEAVGPFGLFLCAGVAALIGFYLWETGRKLGPRPEDDPSALISAAEGEYGFFSPHSWWPLAVAASAAVVFLGLAVGWWLVIIGMFLAALAVIGWTFEYFRGEHAV